MNKDKLKEQFEKGDISETQYLDNLYILEEELNQEVKEWKKF